MFEPMKIESRSGFYEVLFEPNLFETLGGIEEGEKHFLVDSNIARLYSKPLSSVLCKPTTLIIEATEENKTIGRLIPVIENLVANRFRRGDLLIAIGGGIIQDITCFIASTLLRGVDWSFVPTTLLAQADSCIGSKSSINLTSVKNILGTFHPPKKIWIYPDFLNTLEIKDIQSGIGEIIKVHAIAGQSAFDCLKNDFTSLMEDQNILLGYISEALKIKQKYIEVDEFDKGVRNIFNYGHSFGHAIEVATNFGIPHGVAVTIGMDMANHIAVMRGLLSKAHFERMHVVLERNYRNFNDIPIPLEIMLEALLKDKKNTSTELGLILAVGESSEIQRVGVAPDEHFRIQCKNYLKSLKE